MPLCLQCFLARGLLSTPYELDPFKVPALFRHFPPFFSSDLLLFSLRFFLLGCLSPFFDVPSRFLFFSVVFTPHLYVLNPYFETNRRPLYALIRAGKMALSGTRTGVGKSDLSLADDTSPLLPRFFRIQSWVCLLFQLVLIRMSRVLSALSSGGIRPRRDGSSFSPRQSSLFSRVTI